MLPKSPEEILMTAFLEFAEALAALEVGELFKNVTDETTRDTLLAVSFFKKQMEPVLARRARRH